MIYKRCKMHLLSLITANISKSLKKEKFVRVWQGMTQMQNEQGGKSLLTKMGTQKDEAGRQSTQRGRAYNQRTGWSEKRDRLWGTRELGSSSSNPKLGPGDDNSWGPKWLSGQKNQQPGRTRGLEQEPTQQTHTKTTGWTRESQIKSKKQEIK